MEFSLFLLLNGLAVFFLVLMFVFRTIEGENWKGIGTLCHIISLILFLSIALNSIYLTRTSVYILNNTVSEHVVVISDSWIIPLIYVLMSIPLFLLIIPLVIETWFPKKEKGDMNV